MRVSTTTKRHQIVFLNACISSANEDHESRRMFLSVMTEQAIFEAGVQTLLDLATASSSSRVEIQQALRSVGANMDDSRLRDDPTWDGPGFSPQQQMNLDVAAALMNCTVVDNRVPVQIASRDALHLANALIFAVSTLAAQITQSPTYADLLVAHLNALMQHLTISGDNES
jgi:hypothetical protein